MRIGLGLRKRGVSTRSIRRVSGSGDPENSHRDTVADIQAKEKYREPYSKPPTTTSLLQLPRPRPSNPTRPLYVYLIHLPAVLDVQLHTRRLTLPECLCTLDVGIVLREGKCTSKPEQVRLNPWKAGLDETVATEALRFPRRRVARFHSVFSQRL